MGNNNGSGHVGKLWLVRRIDGKLEPKTGGDSPSAETALEFSGLKGEGGLLSWKDLDKFTPAQLEKIRVVHVEGTLAEFPNKGKNGYDLYFIRDSDGSLENRSMQELSGLSHKEITKIHVVHAEGTLAEILNGAHGK